MGKWITPPTLPGEFYCRELRIPDDPYLIGAVMGALWPLAYPGSWEETPGGCSATDTAAAMLAMIWDAYGDDGVCGGNMDVRQSLLDPCTLEKSFDGGETWEPWANLLLCAAEAAPPALAGGAYRVSAGVPEYSLDGGLTYTPIVDDGHEAPYVKPTLATPGDDDDERLCLASTRAALVLANLYSNVYAAAGESIVQLVDTAVDWLEYQFKMLIGVFYWPHAAVLQAQDWANFDYDTHWSAAALTQTQIDNLTCLLLENASIDTDHIVTFDYETVSSQLISVLGVNPGTAVALLVAHITEAGLNTAGSVAITDDGSCVPCSYEDTLTTDFNAGLPAWAFFDASFPAYLWDTGGWGAWRSFGGLSNTGCAVTTPSGGNREECDLIIDLGRECHVYTISLTAWSNAGGDIRFSFHNAAKTEVAARYNPGAYPAAPGTRSWGGDIAGVRYVGILGLHAGTDGIFENLTVTCADV